MSNYEKMLNANRQIYCIEGYQKISISKKWTYILCYIQIVLSLQIEKGQSEDADITITEDIIPHDKLDNTRSSGGFGKHIGVAIVFR